MAAAWQTKVLAYPNPSTGQFRVQLTGLESERVQLMILDVKGTLIQQKSVSAGGGSTIEINLSGNAKGLYLIRIVSGKGVQTTQVLLQ